MFYDNIPLNQSICVLATPRTGSTALCRMLSDKLNLIFLNEIFHPDTEPSQIEFFWSCLQNNSNSIIKIFPNHHNRFTEAEFQQIIEKSFVIFLERKDIAKQIASYHIIERNKKPFYTKNEISNPYEVDEDRITDNVLYILKIQNEAERYRKLANMSIYYEDVVDEIINDHIKEYPKPINYDSIKSKVDDTLSKILTLQNRYQKRIEK